MGTAPVRLTRRPARVRKGRVIACPAPGTLGASVIEPEPRVGRDIAIDKRVLGAAVDFGQIPAVAACAASGARVRPRLVGRVAIVAALGVGGRELARAATAVLCAAQ